MQNEIEETRNEVEELGKSRSDRKILERRSSGKFETNGGGGRALWSTSKLSIIEKKRSRYYSTWQTFFVTATTPC